MYVLKRRERRQRHPEGDAEAGGTLIYASQNAQIWLVLRPTIGSTSPKPPVIGAGSLTGG